MALILPSCIRSVDGAVVNCPICHTKPLKNGFTSQGVQRYRCKTCRKSFLTAYQYAGHAPLISGSIIQLLKEGCGIRSIARLLSISVTTVMCRIRRLASAVVKPVIAMGKCYEMDELRTFVGRKDRLVWIAYALRRDTDEVVDFRIGRRTNKTLAGVIETLLLAKASCICTDKLMNYAWLIPRSLHDTRKYRTNRIERRNLTLRTHLKRLNRRTICFSRSLEMLEACLKIYLWS